MNIIMSNQNIIKEKLIIKFCNKIPGFNNIELIPVITENFSTENNCFSNVEKQVKENGGKVIYGWQIITKFQGISLYRVKAVAHAIWENKNRERICISQQNNAKEIIFFEDVSNTININNNLIQPYNGLGPIAWDNLMENSLIKIQELLEYFNNEYLKYLFKIGYKEIISWNINLKNSIPIMKIDGVEIEVKDNKIKQLIKFEYQLNEEIKLLKNTQIYKSMKYKEIIKQINYKTKNIINLKS